ncbi:MAG: DUF6596 domain-containing protein [Micromonosporaceae bacterium]
MELGARVAGAHHVAWAPARSRASLPGAAGGLHPPATATVVRAQGGQVVTTDGPFAETKEQLGGIWVIEAPDLDAALAWAAKGSAGHTASAGDDLIRSDLCAEAIRLARLLAELMPDEPEVLGLLALLLLTEARRPARTGPGGSLVLLAGQDRSLWDHAMIAEEHDLIRACLRRNHPGPYQLQAAINAVHDDVAAAYDAAIARTANRAERSFLQHQRDSL